MMSPAIPEPPTPPKMTFNGSSNPVGHVTDASAGGLRRSGVLSIWESIPDRSVDRMALMSSRFMALAQQSIVWGNKIHLSPRFSVGEMLNLTERQPTRNRF